MGSFLSLPGTSGNYVSTADVNLLDADTAHLHQSVGYWNVSSTAITDQVLSQALTPLFGDSHGVGTVSGTPATAQARSAGGGSLQTIGAPVSGSTEYSATIGVACNTAGREVQVLFQFYNISNSAAGEVASAWTACSTSGLSVFTLTGTSGAAATITRIAVTIRPTGGVGALTSGEFLYWDAACIRAGAVQTFVPSLRIVGDLDMRAKAAATDWTAVGNQTLIHKAASNNGYALQVTTGGELLAWHGDGTDYNPGTSSGAALTDTVMTELRAAVVEATGVWTYYKNGASFDTDTLGAITAIPDTTTSLLVGAATSTTLLFAGDLEWAEIRDGVGGPVVRRFDARDAYNAHGPLLDNLDTWVGSVDGATWTAHTDAQLTITPGDEPSTGRLLVLGLL